CFRISADRYEVLAIPAEEKLSWPGFSFAAAMKSFSVFPGKSGGTIATSGTAATRETPAKSLTGSYWMLLLMALAIVCPFDVSISGSPSRAALAHRVG